MGRSIQIGRLFGTLGYARTGTLHRLRVQRQVPFAVWRRPRPGTLSEKPHKKR